MYATDDIISETNSKIASYVNPSNMSPLNLKMSFGTRQGDVHKSMKCMFLRKSPSRKYCSPLGIPCNHTGEAETLPVPDIGISQDVFDRDASNNTLSRAAPNVTKNAVHVE